MAERNLNFDEIAERRGTDCLKYDFAKRRGKPADVLPLWVADMDFKTSSYVEDALIERAKHGIFGYSDTQEVYFNAVAGWMERHHHWKIKEDWLIKTPGVVFALAMAVKAFTKAGDSILIQQPVYYPFSEAIRDNGRELVNSPLKLVNGHYEMDFDDLERKIVEHKVTLFLLCSPHNPVGRVWTEEELRRVGDLCVKHNVLVVSDEIHSDFTWPGHEHHVFGNLDPKYAEISITCTAPSKTFNLAGLQTSNIFIPNRTLRKTFKKAIDQAGYSQLNTLGLVACQAAYEEGEPWLTELKKYLLENLDFSRDYIERNLPGVHLIEPEGTYLIWLDFRDLGLPEEKLEHLITKEAKLWLDSGAIFGSDGEGFERINIACPRTTLKEAFDRLAKSLKSLG